MADDVTPEHLGTMLSDNGERLGIISDEGGIWDLMGGRYSNGIPNLDLFLKSHAGSFVRVDRGSRPSVCLQHPALTIAVSPQPDALRSMMKKPGFRGRGVCARGLYALPKSHLGYRHLQQHPVPKATSDAYEQGLMRLLKITPNVNADGQPEPFVLTLSGQAWRCWKSLQEDVEVRMRKGGDLAELTDWSSKLPGAAARIAGLLHCAETEDPIGHREINADTMQRAVMLAAYLIEHAKAAFDLMGADEGLNIAKRLWEVIDKNRKIKFTARDAWNPLHNSIKTVSEAEPGFASLLDHNYITEPPQASGSPSATAIPLP